MKYFKKIFLIITILAIIKTFTGGYTQQVISMGTKIFIDESVKVGVLLSRYDDPYIHSIKKALEDIQKENEGTVQYIFFDGKKDQSIQNKDLDQLIDRNEVDLIILNLVNQDEAGYAIDRIKENNIPVIFFGGIEIQVIKSYNKAYWVGTDTIEGGVLQGEAIIDIWNKNKEKIDNNRDDIMQYIMIKGPINSMYTIERSKYSILTTNKAGIITEELASIYSNWSEEEAKKATEVLLLRFGNNIEMIIVNNDSMALGVIKALQEWGYNLGDGRMTIPVVGFDGTEEALDLIERGIMSGTVIQDPKDSAKAFYTVGMNLFNNRNPVAGTDYEFDDIAGTITLKYKGIMSSF